jgi:hypothetical protein
MEPAILNLASEEYPFVDSLRASIVNKNWGRTI